MDNFFRYFQMQIKRIGRMFPTLQIGILLLILCLGAGAWMIMKNGDYEKQRTRFQVGLVGDTSANYLGFGIQAIQNIDSSRYMVNFQTMTEEEADRALKSMDQEKRLSCYVRIPDGLVESLIYGKNDKKIDCVTANGEGMFAILASELTDVASTLVLNSQSAVYGVEGVLYDYKMADRTGKYIDEFNLRLIDIALNRSDLCEKEILGLHNGISTIGYYLCGILVFFFMLSGIMGSPLFIHRNREMNSLAASKGIGAFAQITGEYLAYAGMNLLCLVEAVLLLGILRSAGAFKIDEWKDLGAEAVMAFLRILIPVSLMVSALQFFIYELVSGTIGSIFLQFICSIVMGYLAGCFYPYTFFPDVLQKIGAVLPTGVALRFVQGGFMEEVPASAGWGLTVYLALFFGLSVTARKLRIGKGR